MELTIDLHKNKLVSDSSRRYMKTKAIQLKGHKIEGNLLAYYPLVTETMKRITGLSEQILHILCYLAYTNDIFWKSKIYKYPDGYGRTKKRRQFDYLIEHELVEICGWHNRRFHQEKRYFLTKKARNIVRMYHRLLLQLQEISQLHFENEVRKWSKAPMYNWERIVKEFNTIVKKEKEKLNI